MLNGGKVGGVREWENFRGLRKGWLEGLIRGDRGGLKEREGWRGLEKKVGGLGGEMESNRSRVGGARWRCQGWKEEKSGGG